MSVTAEGVETPAQRDAPAAVGCDDAQGCLYAQPISVAALNDALDTAPDGTLVLPLSLPATLRPRAAT